MLPQGGPNTGAFAQRAAFDAQRVSCVASDSCCRCSRRSRCSCRGGPHGATPPTRRRPRRRSTSRASRAEPSRAPCRPRRVSRGDRAAPRRGDAPARAASGGALSRLLPPPPAPDITFAHVINPMPAGHGLHADVEVTFAALAVLAAARRRGPRRGRAAPDLRVRRRGADPTPRGVRARGEPDAPRVRGLRARAARRRGAAPALRLGNLRERLPGDGGRAVPRLHERGHRRAGGLLRQGGRLREGLRRLRDQPRRGRRQGRERPPVRARGPGDALRARPEAAAAPRRLRLLLLAARPDAPRVPVCAERLRWLPARRPPRHGGAPLRLRNEVPRDPRRAPHVPPRRPERRLVAARPVRAHEPARGAARAGAVPPRRALRRRRRGRRRRGRGRAPPRAVRRWDVPGVEWPPRSGHK